ncbi:MAG: lamin tail domain-containing protein [Bacteroidales bacterium]|nr:lamin tail domain-containing protein [Bacteroidales bacterium]
MKKNLLSQKIILTAMMMLIGLYSFAQSTIFISQVTDPGDTYQGRYVQLYNSGTAAVDLGAANYYLVKQANGGSYYSVQLTGTIQPGGVFVIAGYTDFSTLYGFSPDMTSSQISGNGDDGYYLYIGGDNTSGTMVDAFGQPDVRPQSGDSWYYENSAAIRNSNICAGNTTWTASEWTIQSANIADLDPANHTCNAGSDVTAPAWDDGYPQVIKVEDTRGILAVNLDEASTAYYVVVASGSTAPTSAEVKAGADYGGVTVYVKGDVNVLTANTTYYDTITGASASTTYDIYVVAEDGSGNIQTAPAKVSVTTTAARSVTMTSPQTGQTYSIAETIPVTWTSANIDSLIVMVYSHAADELFSATEKPIAASLGTYDLKVPPDATLGDYDFYLMDAYDTSFYSKVGPLTLVDNRAISISKPVANQNVYVGDTITIEWTSTLVDSVLIGGHNETQGDYFMLTSSNMDHYDKSYWTPIASSLGTFSFYLDPKMIGGNQTISLYVYDASDTSFKETVTPVNIVDTMPMTISSSAPTFGMTDYPPMGGITCSFNTDIKAGDAGTALHLFKSDGTLVEDVAVGDLNIQGSSFWFTPNPALVPGQSYYITMDAGLVKTADDSKTFSGLTKEDGWSFTVSTSELYFSEYVEGSSNNKALEIYNPTNHDVNLDNYIIASAANGGGIVYDNVYNFPSGTVLKSGEVFVLANSGASSDVLSKANDTLAYNEGGYVAAFNGNDARALVRLVGDYQDWVMVDLIGVTDYTESVSSWDVAGVTGATVDHTLLRKRSVMYGSMNWGASAGTSATDSQWIVWSKDDFTNLGLPTPAGNDQAELTGITLKDNSSNNVTVSSSIDATALTADVTVLSGTDVTQLYADLQVSDGATVSPALTSTFDFSSAKVFTVTSENTLVSKDWTVTVTVAAAQSSEKAITRFSISSSMDSATIDATNHTVALEMPYGTDLTSLTPTIEVSAGATISPTSGTAQDFTNPVTYTVTAQDASTQDWTVTVTAASVVNVPIYDIQHTTDASGDSPYKGQVIKTRGIVTGLDVYNTQFKGFFIQDSVGAWNGLFVFDSQFSTIVVGDSVEVVGTVSEYSGMTELTSLVSATVLAQGKDLPGPVVVTTGEYAAEKWEAVYAKFESATCTDNTLSYGNVAFDDGSGVANTDDFLYAYDQANDFTINNVYNITGVIMYNYGAFTMNPLSATDISDVTGINNPELADKVSLYPNPNNGIFRINTNGIFNGNVRVRVMDVTGRLVYEKVFSNASSISVDISNMSNSIYFLAMDDKYHTVVKKFIKK